MRLEPLYRVRFTYPGSWVVGLEGGWQQMFFIAEGRCEGWVTGWFRGANFPRKQGAAGPFRPDFRAVIEADDGAVIMMELHVYGRAYPLERRQIVGSVFHQAAREPYIRLNDAVCVCAGEVRAPTGPAQTGPGHRRVAVHCGPTTTPCGLLWPPTMARGLLPSRLASQTSPLSSLVQ
jgi:hypothetical protein